MAINFTKWIGRPVFHPSDVSWSQNKTSTNESVNNFCKYMSCPCRLRRKREKIVWVIFIVSIAFLLFKFTLLQSRKSVHLVEKASDEIPSCVLSKLDKNNPDIMKFFSKLPDLKCNKEENWIYVRKGVFVKSPEILKKYRNFTCDLTPILRGADDYEIKDGKVIKNIQDGDLIPSDFFRISCKSNKTKYENIHSAIAKRKLIYKRLKKAKPPPDMLKLNVLMLGIDSVSHMTWLRQLPKSYEYFTQLGGMVLDGYNIVGDGTPQALLPILTGKTEWELPEARRGKPNARTVDGHPWIWKHFKDAGYVTQYGEDAPHIGTFTYRMLGFKDQPTDHYFRTYFLEASKHFSKNKKLCLGSEPRHKIFIDWMKHFVQMYDSVPMFSFLFYSECSHEDNNMIQYLDKDLLSFLTYMKLSKALNNTILILMADHGARFSRVRQSVQGKLEERMPYFSFLFPKWFSKKYPDAYNNFKINTKRLTTPFDIHETFIHLLNFKDFKQATTSTRGISLFNEIPKTRSCQDADIESHWCACLNWKPVSTKNNTIIKAAQKAVSFLNSFTSKHRSKCQEFHLQNITDARILKANKQMLKFKQSSDHDGRYADLSANTIEKEYLIQLTFYVKPGNGLFEITITHQVSSDKYIVKEKEISRINKYGSAPDCIAKKYPHLRQFCYCVGKH
ncbi:uncharacterized protein LOC115216652 [Argonauta hians]